MLNAVRTADFWAKVDKNGDGGCWNWTGSHNNGSKWPYGRFSVNQRPRAAHRVAWEMANGPIPRGAVICHRCDNPRCVNVAHLFIGTPSDNSADMALKKRSTIGERHPMHVITAIEVAEIRRLYRTRAVTQRRLAAQFGVSRSAVYTVLSGRVWKDVPGALTKAERQDIECAVKRLAWVERRNRGAA